MEVDELREAVRGLQMCVDDVLTSAQVRAVSDPTGLEVAADALGEHVERMWEEVDNDTVWLTERRRELASLQSVLDHLQENRQKLDQELQNAAKRLSASGRAVEVQPILMLDRQAEHLTSEFEELLESEKELREVCSELDEHLDSESQRLQRLRSQMHDERMAREDESRRREKWRTEVGLRLKTSTQQLRDLQKETAAELNDFETKAEYKMHWMERGEAAKEEIGRIQPRAEEAESAVSRFEGVEKECALAVEDLSTLGRKALYLIPQARLISSQHWFNEQLVSVLEDRARAVENDVLTVEKETDTAYKQNRQLQDELERLREEKASLMRKLNLQQDVSSAKELIMTDSNHLVQLVHGALS